MYSILSRLSSLLVASPYVQANVPADMLILECTADIIRLRTREVELSFEPSYFNASLFVVKVRESARSHFSSLKDFFKHVLIDELPQQILSPFLTWENCSLLVEFFRCRAGGWWSFALYTHLKYCIPLPSCLRFLRNWMCSCICLTAGSCCFLWIYIRIFLCF